LLRLIRIVVYRCDAARVRDIRELFEASREQPWYPRLRRALALALAARRALRNETSE